MEFLFIVLLIIGIAILPLYELITAIAADPVTFVCIVVAVISLLFVGLRWLIEQAD